MVAYVEVAMHGADLDVARLQRRGIPAVGVDRMAKLFGVPKQRALEAAGISMSTYERLRKGRKPLRQDASEAVTRLLRLHGIASGILPHPTRWFHEATPMLGGMTPFEVSCTEAGGRAVEKLLLRIDVGSVA